MKQINIAKAYSVRCQIDPHSPAFDLGGYVLFLELYDDLGVFLIQDLGGLVYD